MEWIWPTLARFSIVISLIIDTSTVRTTVALCRDYELLFTRHHDGATEHAEILPTLVREALVQSQNIDQVVVGMGPGPFTGLRVGIAFAQSFAHARSLPCHGVCSLDGIDIDSDAYIVTSDARRKELYWARYEGGKRLEGPDVNTQKFIAALAGKKFGFGFTEPLYPSPQLLLARSKEVSVTEPFYLRKPDAVPTSER